MGGSPHHIRHGGRESLEQDEAEAAADRPGIAARIGSRGTFASLAVPQFRLVLAGTVLAQVGGWAEEVARGWLVFQLTDSAFQLGLIGFIRDHATRVLAIAGVMAERLDRRRLAAATQIVPRLSWGYRAARGDGRDPGLAPVHLTCVSGLSQAVNIPTRSVLVYDVWGRSTDERIALNSVVANIAPSRRHQREACSSTTGRQHVLRGLCSWGSLPWRRYAAAVAHAEAPRTPVVAGDPRRDGYVRRTRPWGGW
jgi:hypothetical protein